MTKKSLIHTILGTLAIVATGMDTRHTVYRHHQIPGYTLQDTCQGTKNKVENKQPRMGITFILGEDQHENNPYYTQAIYYYTANPKGKTAVLVNSCRSMVDVAEYLRNHPPANGEPWGVVNLVSHGNEWLGLSVRVTPEGQRATPEALATAVRQKQFPAIPAGIIDSQTVIEVHGCGLGNNERLLKAIGNAFGQMQHRFVVQASKLFVYYTSITEGAYLQATEKYLADAYSIRYPMGYPPSKLSMAQQLSRQYPNIRIDWADALRRTQPRWTGDQYHSTFQVPLKWVVPLDSLPPLPNFNVQSELIAWVSKQPRFVQRLEALGFQAKNFNWWARNVFIRDPQGEKKPALWLKGYATVLTVLRAKIEESAATSIGGLPAPFNASNTNKAYYFNWSPYPYGQSCQPQSTL